jgi:hypothetical protein
MGDIHVRTVAAYVQEQIYKYAGGKEPKLELIIKHAALNVNYGLSNFYTHKLYNCNPDAKKKQGQIEQKQIVKCAFKQDIGVNIPHYNPSQMVRDAHRKPEVP